MHAHVAGAFALLALAGVREAAAVPDSIANLDADEVAAWCDEMFAPMLEHRRFAGLAVVVVQNGAVLTSRGYGFADAARGTPLSPGSTRLRIGSITKTMTAVVILQLVNEGRIASLDDPVNIYLRRYQLADYRGTAVTLRHLLTHTAGFEAVLFGLGTEGAADVPARASYIRQVTPRHVRPPGSHPVYSNFGFQTLGAVAEDLTGQRMSELLAERILRPLGMSESALSHDQRPSANLGQPYAYFPNGDLQAVPYIAMHPFTGAAGGVQATPDDMARYMLAQLDRDDSSTHRVLPPHLLRDMHRRHAGANETVPGFGLGVFVADRDGLHIVDHPGGWPGFSSLMTLVPDKRLGIFISVMAASPVPSIGEVLIGSARLRNATAPAIGPALVLYDLYGIREAFLDGFVGARKPPSFVVTEASPVIGRYRDAERNHTSAEAILGLLGSSSVVRLTAANAIEVNGDGPYRAIAAASFSKPLEPTGSIPRPPQRYAFTRAQTGEIAYVVDGTGLSVYERVSAFESPRLWRQWIVVTALLCLSAVALLRRREMSPWSRISPWLPVGILLCLIIQSLVLFVGFEQGHSFFFDLLAGRSARLAALVLLGDLMAICVLATIVAAIASWPLRLWGQGRSGVLARLHFSVIAFAVAALMPILFSLNLVGLPRILE